MRSSQNEASQRPSTIAASRPSRRGRSLAATLFAALICGCTMSGPAGPKQIIIGYGPDGPRMLDLQPVSEARMTSGFGERWHPILGGTKMHYGIDWAAPVGTSIRAAADGIVVRASARGGYGNYVRLRHDDMLETAYGHLDTYAPSLKRGDRVRQGEVIGTVGASGRATGPHLHFETLLDGRPVDPFTISPSIMASLKADTMEAFSMAHSGFREWAGVIAEAAKSAVSKVNGIQISGPTH